jgi:hypothetical protein
VMYSIIPNNFVSKSRYGLRVNEFQSSLFNKLSFGLFCAFGFKNCKCPFFK